MNNKFHCDDVIAILDTATSGDALDASQITNKIDKWFSKILSNESTSSIDGVQRVIMANSNDDNISIDLSKREKPYYIQSYKGWTELLGFNKVVLKDNFIFETISVGDRSFIHVPCNMNCILSWDIERKSGFHGDSKYDSKLVSFEEICNDENHYGRIQYIDPSSNQDGFALIANHDTTIETITAYEIITKSNQFCVNNIVVTSIV